MGWASRKAAGEEKLWLIGPLALQLQLGCVALCSCKRHVARACPAAPPLQQTLNLWIPAAPSLQQQQQTSFLASCSQQHCTPATHLKYRIDRQQQQQSRPWVLRSNGRRGGGRVPAEVGGNVSINRQLSAATSASSTACCNSAAAAAAAAQQVAAGFSTSTPSICCSILPPVAGCSAPDRRGGIT